MTFLRKAQRDEPASAWTDPVGGHGYWIINAISQEHIHIWSADVGSHHGNYSVLYHTDYYIN